MEKEESGMEKDSWHYLEWFPKRLAALRSEKGVSARDMSLSAGLSETYINKIENGHALPSMHAFFYICEYLGITPEEFFAEEMASPEKTRELLRALQKLTPAQAEHVLWLVREISEK